MISKNQGIRAIKFMKTKIEKLLRQALLKNGKMEYALFEFELEKHINYWYQGLKRDGEEFVFVVSENTGDVAMLLITKEQDIYVNEDAREQLVLLWDKSYPKNMERIIPRMAEELVNGILAVTGVKIASPELIKLMTEKKKKSAISKKLEANMKACFDKYKYQDNVFLPESKSDK
ncbi:hypothetical protein [Brunnivagina elsteri]|uniref:hypothetical protein n=1 Tax=Brunnivagina elsteri TaxID=1247191 RepID=UPI001B805CA6|nr:hypothetical protein [Calothrix elsteri]